MKLVKGKVRVNQTWDGSMGQIRIRRVRTGPELASKRIRAEQFEKIGRRRRR